MYKQASEVSWSVCKTAIHPSIRLPARVSRKIFSSGEGLFRKQQMGIQVQRRVQPRFLLHFQLERDLDACHREGNKLLAERVSASNF